jgi:uroporphyrinogen-III decarboxylase
MDLAVWLCGVERVVMAAMTEPDFLEELLEIIHAFDQRRTGMMLDVGGVDVVVQRGWYSSTEFWSPRLFERFLQAGLRKAVEIAHQAGAHFAYVMTAGELPMANQLLASGIDLLYYVDPARGKTGLALVKQKLGDRIALAGGVSAAVTLDHGSPEEIRQAVRTAVSKLGPTGFILAPVDAVFPDTPWPNLEAMIDAWREVREV